MQLLLVGNKCDLSSERAVSHAEAEQVCIHILCDYAFYNINLNM